MAAQCLPQLGKRLGQLGDLSLQLSDASVPLGEGCILGREGFEGLIPAGQGLSKRALGRILHALSRSHQDRRVDPHFYVSEMIRLFGGLNGYHLSAALFERPHAAAFQGVA